MSHLLEPHKWAGRRVSILGVAKSFVSQLSVGQDLTKLSLPSVFCNPFSLLEVGGFRFSNLEELFKANETSDPVQRLLCVLSYFFSIIQLHVQFDKKPFNPILGEIHHCYTDCPISKNGRTLYLSEQVVHHPPVSAYVVENQDQNIRVTGNVTFGLKFHGNSVTINSSGFTKVLLGNFGEEYEFSPSLPNKEIKNVILGTRRMPWDGVTTIVCKKTGYHAKFTFKEEGYYCVNTVNGSIFNEGSSDPLFTFSGSVEEKITLKNLKTSETQEIIDVKKIVFRPPTYLSKEEMDPLESILIWSDVNEAIIKDDIPNAEIAKKKIEDAQRKRRVEGKNYQPRFFQSDTSGNWDFLGKFPKSTAQDAHISNKSRT